MTMATWVSAEPLSLSDMPEESLGIWSEVLVEDGAPLSLDEAQIKQQNGLFRKADRSVLTYGIGARPRWVHLDISNPTNQRQSVFLITGVSWLDRLDVYVVKDHQVTMSWQTGDEYAHPFGLAPGVGFSFPVLFASGNSDLYLRVQSIDPMVLPIQLITNERLLASDHVEKYLYGLFYGYLFALLAYNALLFFGQGKRSHLYFALYLLSLVLLNIAYTGHGAYWFWHDLPSLQRYIIQIFIVLYGCSGLMFATKFLDLEKHAPRVFHVSRLFAISGSGLMLLSLVFDSQLGAAWVAFVFLFLFTIGMVYLGGIAVRIGAFSSRFFLVSALFGMLGATMTMLSVWGWIPFNSFTYHGFEYGFFIETTLLALALSNRYNEMQRHLSGLLVSREELLREIAEHQRAKEERQEALDRLNKISGQVPGVVFQFRLRQDGSSCFPYISDGIGKIFRLNAESVRQDASGILAVVHPDDLAGYMDSIHRSAQYLLPWINEYRVRFSDGAEQWLFVNAIPQREVDGSTLWHGLIADITDRKVLEKRLEELLVFNATILDQSPSGIAVYKISGSCVMANMAYARMIGATVEEVLKQNFRDNDSWKRNGLLDIANQVIADKKIIKRDIEGKTSFGKHVILECSFAYVYSAEESHLLLITSDISERVRVERALGDSMLQLEKKEQSKSRFLAAAGHDLRQPLAAANMFIYTLKTTALTPQQIKYVERLELSMSTLGMLLNALLDISKLDMGVIEPVYSSINLSDVCFWLNQSFEEQAREKYISLRVHCPIRETVFVHVDLNLLQSVLMNLVGNAIKFTSTGGILVSARKRGGKVLFQVRDTGIGIPENEIAYIFDEFYQVNNPQRNRVKGLGLGLAIVKRTLALMGSAIECKSYVDKGTIFQFSLPLATDVMQVYEDEDIQTAEITDSFMRGKKAILVEDDSLIVQAMAMLLAGKGCKVKSFSNAEDALASATIWHADFYIVDYMLGGGLNGIQFLNKLHKQLDRPIKAVLVTGDTSEALKSESVNFSWPILHKPVNIYELFVKLKEQKEMNAG